MQKRTRLLVTISILLLTLNISLVIAGDQNSHYDLFLRTGGSWKMAVKDYTVSTETWTRDTQKLPGKYFHGAKFEGDESRQPGPVLLHVNYPVQGEFIFYVETVSDTGIIKIMLDNKELETYNLLTGPAGKGPWVASRYMNNGVYQCDYQQEFKVTIPAGKHDISIQNMGTDWISINYMIFTNYADKVMDPEYQNWTEYKTTLGSINDRLAAYKKQARNFAALGPDDTNFDLIPTMCLQLENFEHLVNHHTPIDYNLLRTENELEEIFAYLNAGNDYFKQKRGRIKVGYLSELDSTYQPYDIVIPGNYDPAKRYALFLDLHGYQVELRKYSKLLEEDSEAVMDTLDAIRVALYGRRNHMYHGAAEKDLFTVLELMQAKYAINPDKVYLMGSSMGGYGTWLNALNHPDKFAAISPVCPPSQLSETRFLTTASPMELVGNAQHLPARIYHGAIDPTVNVNDSRQMVAKLKKLGYEHVYKEYPDVAHDAWNNAGADRERLPWLLQYTRNLYPASVKYRIFYLAYGKAYWLTITGKQDWNKFAEISAELTGKNTITINTKNVASLAIDTKHPDLEAGTPVTIEIDGQSLVAETNGQDIPLYYNASGWVNGACPVSGLAKKAGLEGPFIDLETSKFLMVYGTGNPANATILEKIGNRLQSQYAVSDMDIKLLPDTTVIKQNLAATHNLYLLGAPDENLYTKQIINDLPLSFDATSFHLDGDYDRKECGVQMIYPNPRVTDKYVFIDVYPQSKSETGNAVIYRGADYYIYSIKDDKRETLKDTFFDSFWQVVK